MNSYEQQLEVLNNQLEEAMKDKMFDGQDLPRCLRYIDEFVDEDEVLCLRTIERTDYEFEKDSYEWTKGGLEMDEFGFPKWVDGELTIIEENEIDAAIMSSSSYTYGAENPVIECEADIASKMRWRGELPPEVNYYPIYVQNKKRLREWINEEMVKYSIRCNQQERLNAMLGFIAMAPKQKLYVAWKRFWNKFFGYKTGEVIDWSTMAMEWINVEQQKLVKEAFASRGITKKEKKAAGIPSNHPAFEDIPIKE